MKKFLVLYKATPEGFAAANQGTPEQHQAGMDAWNAWGKSMAGSIVDMGGPAGKTVRVSSDGVSATSNDIGGYSIMQGESKEALGEALRTSPHFLMPGAFIEIVDLPGIPGM